MNNKKQTKQPLFAEVNLTGDEFRQSPSTHMQRTRFLKLVDKLWATHNKSVMVVAPFFNLTMDEHRILKPLKEAHRRHEYVGTKGHNTFVEAHLDTPNIRVIISDFNDIEFVPFDGQKL